MVKPKGEAAYILSDGAIINLLSETIARQDRANDVGMNTRETIDNLIEMERNGTKQGTSLPAADQECHLTTEHQTEDPKT